MDRPILSLTLQFLLGSIQFFSKDFDYVVADDGLYSYSSGAYSRFLTMNFHAKKKFWVNQGKILVFSWADSVTPG
jgi:hypothetical protein